MTELGQKIRRLRIAAQMTQAELAGDQITRNMLSQIETGGALPSLPTIQYLAQKLEIPAGYFFAEEEDEFLYRKMQKIKAIKRAYTAGHWQQCMELCQENLGGSDDEINLMLAECAYHLALEAFAQGRLCAAHTCFVQTIEYASLSLYDTTSIVRTAYDYLHYLAKFDSALEIPAFIRTAPSSITSDQPWFSLYLHALRIIEKGNPDTADHLIGIEDFADTTYASHLRAKIAMARREYSTAIRTIEELLTPERGLPPSKPMTYLLYLDLEVCCREIGDFERAYRYTTSRVKLLDVLLTE
ncbi:MAG: helix-turn-helix transcriptional regulator [Clostridia bacterium]|nr:helix-turn-helix transcriptional regulator [Clostridia bacterium]